MKRVHWLIFVLYFFLYLAESYSATGRADDRSFTERAIHVVEDPTSFPTAVPSMVPSVVSSNSPTNDQNAQPQSSLPSCFPTSFPSMTTSPTSYPSINTKAPQSFSPTSFPSKSIVESNEPTSLPTTVPSHIESSFPSSLPSSFPSSSSPSILSIPSSAPSSVPTLLPSTRSSSLPTSAPSSISTAEPSSSPSSAPSSSHPSSSPSSTPSKCPSSIPTSIPSSSPSRAPSSLPSAAPSTIPSSSPTSAPTPGGSMGSDWWYLLTSTVTVFVASSNTARVDLDHTSSSLSDSFVALSLKEIGIVVEAIPSNHSHSVRRSSLRRLQSEQQAFPFLVKIWFSQTLIASEAYQRVLALSVDPTNLTNSLHLSYSYESLLLSEIALEITKIPPPVTPSIFEDKYWVIFGVVLLILALLILWCLYRRYVKTHSEEAEEETEEICCTRSGTNRLIDYWRDCELCFEHYFRQTTRDEDDEDYDRDQISPLFLRKRHSSTSSNPSYHHSYSPLREYREDDRLSMSRKSDRSHYEDYLADSSEEEEEGESGEEKEIRRKEGPREVGGGNDSVASAPATTAKGSEKEIELTERK